MQEFKGWKPRAITLLEEQHLSATSYKHYTLLPVLQLVE
jgi:hypothetical protein